MTLRLRTQVGARVCAVVGLVSLSAFAAACSSDSADGDWRSIDPCALVEQSDLARVSDGPGVLVSERTEKDNATVGCKFVEPPADTLRLSVGLTDQDADLGELPPFAVKRTFVVSGREAYVTYERGGNCHVSVQFRGVAVSMQIEPDRDMHTVAPDDTSAASCDAQIPVLESIAERVGLP